MLQTKPRWPGSKWLWILPLAWFGWQLISATQTVDRELTIMTLGHFVGVLVCYFIGALVLGNERCLHLVLIGVMAAFAFCLVRAVNQKLIEFPADREFLIQSEQAGWTNLPAEIVLEMKRSRTIITTNGMDVANPVILKKYENGRVFGTLVYPNALAGAILLLFPSAIVLAVRSGRRFRTLTRISVVGLTAFLGLGTLFWTGSKSGWLIALGLGGVWLLRLNWPRRLKWTVVGAVLLVGLGLFAFRFQGYFSAGATSVGARFDYWRAAVQTTASNPVFGSGPGTFQRPYERIKAPEAEMARLAHNDYLEQFSDSGVPGGVSYSGWICLLLGTLGLRLFTRSGPLLFAVFLGCLGWFAQGLSEFGLYIPALAWIAFVFLGALLGITGNQIDKAKAPR